MHILFTNTVVQWIGAALSRSIGLVLTLVLTRSLGSDQFGKYTLIYTFLSFFTLLASFGLQTIAARDAVQNPQNTPVIFGDLIVLTALFAILSSGACIITARLFSYGDDILYGMKIASLSILLIPICSSSLLFQINFKMHHTIISSLIRDMSLLILACYLWHTKSGYIGYVCGTVFASILSAAYIITVGRSILKPRFTFALDRYWAFIRASLPLAISGIALYIYNYIDSIMISKMSTASMLAFYSIAYKFVFLGQEIPKAILTSVFPLLAHSATADKSLSLGYFQRSFDTITLAGMFICVIGILYGEKLIVLLFGSGYQTAFIPFAIFCVNFIFMFPNMLLSQYMISIGSQKIVLLFMSTVAIINIIINIFVIPLYGIAGAALATMASEITFCALSFIFLRVRDRFRIDFTPAIKMFSVSAVLIVIGHNMVMPVALHCAIVALLFVISTYYLRAYDYGSVYNLLIKTQYRDKGYLFR